MSIFDTLDAEEELETLSQGELINRLINLRSQMRVHETAHSNLKNQFKTYKLQLIDKLKTANSLSGKTPMGTATLTNKTVPNLADKDLFWAYVIETRDPSLVSHARPATEAILELYKMGVQVPGTELVTLEDISLRIS